MSSLKDMLSTFYQVCQYRVAIAFANNRLPRYIPTYFLMYHNVGRIFELPGIRLRFSSLPLVMCKGEKNSDGIFNSASSSKKWSKSLSLHFLFWVEKLRAVIWFMCLKIGPYWKYHLRLNQLYYICALVLLWKLCKFSKKDTLL